MEKNYLIVVSVLEGRYFPSRCNYSLIVEAKFDGETMSTDPVPHSCNPNFNTELAWCVDRKSLHTHRIHRTPVKLQCMAIDNTTRKTEVCGYLVLEIRSIQERKKLVKWYPLLNTKYHGTKPELKIIMHLEKDTVENSAANSNKDSVVEHVVNADRTNVQQRGSHSSGDASEELVPRLNVENGCIEIGPDSAATQLFMYGITVSYAANLNQLVSKSDKPKLKPPYYFLYHLLGNEVITESFESLSDPKFAAERASVRIYSNPETLQKFFRANSSLQIFLCFQNIVFGEAVIPLNEFFTGTAVPKYPVRVEGIFQLHPVPPNEELESQIKPKYRPFVAVQAEIYFPDPEVGRENHSDPELNDTAITINSVASVAQEHSPRRANSLDRGMRTSRWRKEEQQRLPYSPPQRLAKQKDAETGHAHVDPCTQESKIYFMRHCQDFICTDTADCVCVALPGSAVPDTVPKVPNLTSENEKSEQVHHYCFTLDVRSIYLYPPCPSIQGYVRYCYPFFGTSSTFESERWTELRPDTQVIVQGGYCSFNFASTAAMLEDAFRELPLHIEVVCLDKGKECLFGASDIELSAILSCPSSTFMGEDGKSGLRRTLTSKVPLSISGGTLAGELQAIIWLDDLGRTALPDGASVGGVGKAASKQETPTKKNSTAPTEEVVTATLTELEVWKQQQEILFRKQLKEKEDMHLKALTEEWKQHDIERERILKKKLKEYQDLDERLKAALEDVCKREQTLAQREAEVAKQKNDLQHLKLRLHREKEETISRSQNEYRHLLELERKKSSNLENETKRLKSQLRDLDRLVKDKEKELEVQAEGHKTASSEDLKLRIDFDKLRSENYKLLKELDEVYNQRREFEQKWHSVTEELETCKKKIEGLERDTLRTQRDQVEALYQRSVARLGQRLPSEGEDVTQPKTLPKVQATTREDTAMEQRKSPSNVGMHGSTNRWTGAWSQHIKRLIEERDTLLKTGVYTREDRMIVELNKHITEALGREKR